MSSSTFTNGLSSTTSSVSHRLLESPSKYTAVPPNWADEQQAIGDRVGSVNYEQKILNLMKDVEITVKPLHEHYCRAMAFLARFPIPKNFEEFMKNNYFSNWDTVGEIILLGVRAGRLGITVDYVDKPGTFFQPIQANSFHMLICGIYVEEHGFYLCEDCGLPEGPWCSKYPLSLLPPGANDSSLDGDGDTDEDYGVDNDPWYDDDEDMDFESEEVSGICVF